MARKPRPRNMKGFDLGRLCESAQRDRLVQKQRRENRREMVREYLGFRWSEEGARRKVVLNLLALYVQITQRTLAAKSPRLMLSTFNKQGKAAVAAMETWANREIETQGIAETLQRIVIDSLFSIGIGKVALADPADAASSGWEYSAGQPFFESVDLDDFVCDMHARKWRDCYYIGHRRRVLLESVRESRAFNASRKDLVATDDNPFNQQGDERISMLGRTYYAANGKECADYVDLWELYIPERRLIVVMPDDALQGPDKKAKPIMEMEWIGDDDGPFHFLGMGVAPGNLFPTAPIQNLFDLHCDTNENLRKLIRQAARMKQLNLFQRGGDDDAKRMQKANDGDWVGVDNPEKIQMQKGMGPSTELGLFADTLKQAFSWIAGNLDVAGGLSPQAKTAHQEAILNQNSAGTMADMQATMARFTQKALGSWCWLHWHHPQNVMKADYPLPGLNGQSITRQVFPNGHAAGQQGHMTRDVPWKELDLQVVPWSMSPDTPSERADALKQLVMDTILPGQQAMAAQGIGFDWNEYLVKFGHYKNMPDLSDLLTVQEPPQQDAQGAGEPQSPSMPNTPTQNTRLNVPMRSEAGASQQLRAKLSGVDVGGSPNGKPAGMAG